MKNQDETSKQIMQTMKENQAQVQTVDGNVQAVDKRLSALETLRDILKDAGHYDHLKTEPSFKPLYKH